MSLLDDLVLDIGEAQQGLLDSKGGQVPPRLKHTSDSITSNLNFILYLDISLKFNFATALLSQPGKAVPLARQLVTAEVSSINGLVPRELRRLISRGLKRLCNTLFARSSVVSALGEGLILVVSLYVVL